jgi:nitroreductase
MDFNEVIRRRRMVREFTTEPLAPGVATRLLRAANRAPSAGFSQGYAFLVLEDADERAAFWKACFGAEAGIPEDPAPEELQRAPLIIVPLACRDAYLDRYARPDKGWTDRDEARWPVPYWYIDTGFAALLTLLAAVDEGLGAVFIGIGPGQIPGFRAEFGVPAEYTPIGAVAVGHPDPGTETIDSADSPKRRTLDDLVHQGRW